MFKALKTAQIPEIALLSLSSEPIYGIRGPALMMGSILGDLPSFDPHNFSELRPSDPSNPSKMTPITYHPTHDRTLPPPDQVISSEAKNILLRHFYMRAEEKLRPKRAASESLTPDHVCKHPRASTSEAPL